MSEGASVGFIWVNHEEFSADDCGTLEAPRNVPCAAGEFCLWVASIYLLLACI